MLFASLKCIGRLALIWHGLGMLYCWLSKTAPFSTPCCSPSKGKDGGDGGIGGNSADAQHNDTSYRACHNVVTRMEILPELEDLISSYAAVEGAAIHHLYIWRAEPERFQLAIGSSRKEPQSTAPLWESENGDIFRDVLLLIHEGICLPLQHHLAQAKQLLAITRPESIDNIDFARRWVDESCKSIHDHRQSLTDMEDQDTGTEDQDFWFTLGRGPLFRILDHLSAAQLSLRSHHSRGGFDSDNDEAMNAQTPISRSDQVLSDVLIQTLFKRPWPVSSEELLRNGFREDQRDEYEARKLFWENVQNVQPELRNDLDPRYRHVLRRTIATWESILDMLRDQLLPAVSLYLAMEVQKEEALAEQHSSLFASSWTAALIGIYPSWHSIAPISRNVNQISHTMTSIRRQISYLQAIIHDTRHWEELVASLEERRAVVYMRLEANRNGQLWASPHDEAPHTNNGSSPSSSKTCDGKYQVFTAYQFPAPEDLCAFFQSAHDKLKGYHAALKHERMMSALK